MCTLCAQAGALFGESNFFTVAQHALLPHPLDVLADDVDVSHGGLDVLVAGDFLDDRKQYAPLHHQSQGGVAQVVKAYSGSPDSRMSFLKWRFLKLL